MKAGRVSQKVYVSRYISSKSDSSDEDDILDEGKVNVWLKSIDENVPANNYQEVNDGISSDTTERLSYQFDEAPPELDHKGMQFSFVEPSQSVQDLKQVL